MDFLNKLYESNYFGIGLFAVISFLVITFLVVLFFGKKDEKKRKLEETNSLKIENNNQAFKEVSEAVPVEVPAPVVPTEEIKPVAPINIEPVETPVAPVNPTPVMPINPFNYENEPLKPVAPIHYEEPEENNFVENLTVEEPKVELVSPEKEVEIPITPIEPIRIEPTRYENNVEPKKVEPIRFTIPEEPVKVEPLIKEEETPIITPVIEEPMVMDTYYKPVEKVEPEEIKVPNIDFDAIAKSISKELDELEKSTMNHTEEVKVTPMSEIAKKPTNQFSSVYVSEPVKNTVKEPIDLPKKIDLPTKKSEEIEPESYSI